MSDKSKVELSNEAKNIIKEVTRQNRKVKPKLSIKTARSFNLPAFVFPVIYNCIYKRIWLAAIFLILTGIPHYAENFTSSSSYLSLTRCVTFITLLLAVISGITGNQHAYDSRNYDDEEDFIKSQRFWLPFAILGIIVHLCIFPIQNTGHYNKSQMIKLSEAKSILNETIQRGAREGKTLGVDVPADNVPEYFAKYIRDGKFNNEDTITMKNGIVFKIAGHVADCGTVAKNTYHEDKTACATVSIDLNTSKNKNKTQKNKTQVDDIKASKGALSNTKRLGDLFTLYAYNDGVAPKEGSTEQYIFRKFDKE